MNRINRIFYHSEIRNEEVKQSIGKWYIVIFFRTFRDTAYVAAEHIELTLCTDKYVIELLK